MDTVQEALFKAMLNESWFTESEGHVESPQGFFGWTVIEEADLKEIFDAFEDTIRAYGNPGDISGVWYAWINSDGIIRTVRVGDVFTDKDRRRPYLGIPPTITVSHARKWFNDRVRDYTDWSNDAE